MLSGTANPSVAAADKSDGDAMKAKSLSPQSAFRRIRYRRLGPRMLCGVPFALARHSETTESLMDTASCDLNTVAKPRNNCQFVFGISKR